MSMTARTLANPPISLPQYVPADSADIAASLDVRDVCGAATTELSALLERPLNVFWSYVLHCPALMAFIDSYLRFAPRNLGLHSEEANTLATEEVELRQTVLLVLMRLATPAESAALMSDAQWAETVYDNWVFSAPSLLDVCALYGFSREEQCSQMVRGVLASQPAFADDVAEALCAAAEALAQVCGRPPAGAKALPLPSVLVVEGLDDVARLSRWLQDSTGSLHAMLHVAAEPVAACLSHREAAGTSGTTLLLASLQLAFEAALPLLRRKLRTLAATAAATTDAPATRIAEHARSHLRGAAFHAVHAAHALLHEGWVEPTRRRQPGGAEQMLVALEQLGSPCEVMPAALPLYISAEVTARRSEPSVLLLRPILTLSMRVCRCRRSAQQA